jgi:hypothetical protein
MKIDWMDAVIGFIVGFMVNVFLTKYVNHVPKEVKIESAYVDTFSFDNLSSLSNVLDSAKYFENHVIEKNALEKNQLNLKNQRLDWEVEFLAEAYNGMYLDYHDTAQADTSAFKK